MVLSSASSFSSSVSIAYSVVISEVMWMGTDLSTADEWIELAAFSDDAGSAEMPVSLGGWTLRSVKDGVEQTIIRFASGSLVQVGHFALISNYAEPQSRISVSPFAVSTGMSLANTKLLLRLYDSSNVLRDEVDDGIGNPFAGVNTSAQKASMERIDLRSPGALITNWKAATVSAGFDAVPFPLFGTPGYPNGAQSSSSASSISSVSSVSSSSPSSSSQSSTSSVASSSSSSSSFIPLPSLAISEVMPDPVGSDDFEWIEIVNTGSGIVSTAGVTVSMTGGTLRTLPIADLLPGDVVHLSKEQTHLTLPNAGGTVQLRKGTALLDVLTYPSLPEGISFGPDASGIRRPLCLPTPGFPNTSSGSQVAIDVQSGMPTGETVTLNLSVRSIAGSLQGAVCHWEYPDGYASDSCNPASHAIDSFGAGEITLHFTDYCGNTVLRSLPVFVTKKPTKLFDKEIPGVIPFSCMPSAFTGALITEFLPNPDGDEAEGEWIEIKNVSGKDLPLCGWSLEDATGNQFDLRHFRLPLDETLVFTRKQTDITLNNDADTVRLLAPDPAGGSGIVIQEIAYTRSPAQQTFAMRDDGMWIWTPRISPGAPNLFPEVVIPSVEPKARLSAAMPNPKGTDEGVEWIEIENLTNRPLWMQKWRIHADIDADLSGKAIHPYATRRLPAAELGLSLRNASGSIRLFDETGMEMSPLVWESPHDDEIVLPPTFTNHVSAEVIRVLDTGDLEVKTDEADVPVISLLGMHIYSYNKNCIDLESALIKNKKIELYFNTVEEGFVVYVNGNSIADVLLKSGCAYRSHASDEGVFLGYDVYEQEGRLQRRGIWADANISSQVIAMQSQEELLRVVREDGIILQSSLKEDLISSGTVLSFHTNLPASIHVSMNEAPFALWNSGAVLNADSFIQAYAQVDLGGGSVMKSDIFEHAYILRKENYDRLQLLSEIFPSPKKGEKEWLELYNPTDIDLNLAGWQLDDGLDEGSRPFTLTSDMHLPAHSYLIIRDIKIAWNNGGDAIRLIAPDGTVADSAIYPKVKTGFAFSLKKQETGEWCLTEKTTPEISNICYISPKNKNSRSALSKSKKSSSESRKILYKNIVHKTQKSHLFEMLFPYTKMKGGSLVSVPVSPRRALIMLLAFYCVCIALFLRFRRY